MACVLVLAAALPEAAALACPWRRRCAAQQEVQPIGGLLDDVRRPTPREARQYHGATGLGGYYGGATGHPPHGLHGAVAGSSTSFDGLDAGLSALAFLAFGVWLFNLVLPQLQALGLGLPGIRRSRRNASSVVGLLSNVPSSSHDLLEDLFGKGTSRETRLGAEWSGRGGETLDRPRSSLTSPSDNGRRSAESVEEPAKEGTATPVPRGSHSGPAISSTGKPFHVNQRTKLEGSPPSHSPKNKPKWRHDTSPYKKG